MQAVPKEGYATLSCPRGCDGKTSMFIEARYLSHVATGRRCAGLSAGGREGTRSCLDPGTKQA
jgi:hypothetical protein